MQPHQRQNSAIDTTVVTLTGSPSGVEDLVVTGFTKGGGMMALQCLDNTGQGFIGTLHADRHDRYPGQ